MNHISKKNIAWLIIFIAIICFNSTALAENNRPFWTEKSTFIEGEILYVVGIASNAETIEEGRVQAFEHGKIELANYVLLTNIEGYDIALETQMTFEEKNEAGTYNVFRLLFTDLNKLTAVQEKINAQTRNQSEKLKNLIVINQALTENLISKNDKLEQVSTNIRDTFEKIEKKEQELSTTSQKAEDILSSLKTTQESIKSKSKDLDTILNSIEKNYKKRDIVIAKIEEKERELNTTSQKAEDILNNLNTIQESIKSKSKDLDTILNSIEKNYKKRDIVIAKIEEKKAEVQEQEIELDKLLKQFLNHIVNQDKKVEKYIRKKLTKNQVKQLLGEPDANDDYAGNDFYYYGSYKLIFRNRPGGGLLDSWYSSN